MSHVGREYALEVGILTSMKRGKLLRVDVITSIRAKYLSTGKSDQALLAKPQFYEARSLARSRNRAAV